jgi:prevent-host-death family protein
MDTETVAISDARANLTEIVANVRILSRPVILTQRGKPRAVLVPLEMFERMQGKPAAEPKPQRKRAAAPAAELAQPASPRDAIRSLPSMR